MEKKDKTFLFCLILSLMAIFSFIAWIFVRDKYPSLLIISSLFGIEYIRNYGKKESKYIILMISLILIIIIAFPIQIFRDIIELTYLWDLLWLILEIFTFFILIVLSVSFFLKKEQKMEDLNE